MIRQWKLYLSAALVAAMTYSTAHAQAYTEFRDPLRGVTFYSVQISTDPLLELQSEGSKFSDSDQMTVGLSAFFFDQSDAVDDYVLWLRHDGPRQWFVGVDPLPLTTVIDGKRKTFAPLHATRPQLASGSGPFVEKLEFEFLPADFQALARSDAVTLELNTLLGVVEKTLGVAELEAIRMFDRRVRERHEEAMLQLEDETGLDSPSS